MIKLPNYFLYKLNSLFFIYNIILNKIWVYLQKTLIKLEIQLLKKDISELQVIIQQKNNEIREKDEEILNLKKLLDCKTKEITRLQSEIEELKLNHDPNSNCCVSSIKSVLDVCMYNTNDRFTLSGPVVNFLCWTGEFQVFRSMIFKEFYVDGTFELFILFLIFVSVF
jgi:predicted RNase H-like nuclease (RuvC/YqgF family)